MEAPDVEDLEHFRELLAKQRRNMSTAEDVLMIEKEMWKRALGVDALNEKIMKCFYRKDHTIKNYINLIDEEQPVCGADDETAQAVQAKDCLRIVRELIQLMGYDSTHGGAI